MADFLTRLVERTLGVATPIRPVIAPMFAPEHIGTAGAALDVEDADGREDFDVPPAEATRSRESTPARPAHATSALGTPEPTSADDRSRSMDIHPRLPRVAGVRDAPSTRSVANEPQSLTETSSDGASLVTGAVMAQGDEISDTVERQMVAPDQHATARTDSAQPGGGVKGGEIATSRMLAPLPADGAHGSAPARPTAPPSPPARRRSPGDVERSPAPEPAHHRMPNMLNADTHTTSVEASAQELGDSEPDRRTVSAAPRIHKGRREDRDTDRRGDESMPARAVPAVARIAPERASSHLGAEVAPVIHVSIGRIEVRAIPTPVAPPNRSVVSSAMSLDDYLRDQHTNGGRR